VYRGTSDRAYLILALRYDPDPIGTTLRRCSGQAQGLGLGLLNLAGEKCGPGRGFLFSLTARKSPKNRLYAIGAIGGAGSATLDICEAYFPAVHDLLRSREILRRFSQDKGVHQCPKDRHKASQEKILSPFGVPKKS